MSNLITQIYIDKSTSKLLKEGHPWVYENSITNLSSYVTLNNNEIVHLIDPKGQFIATAITDNSSKLAIRVIDYKALTKIDIGFFINKINLALNKRLKNTCSSYYRLINYEGDNLPGLCIDRFGEIFKIETNLEFYYIYKDLIVDALKNLFQTLTIVIKFSNLPELLLGTYPNELIIIEENESKFYIDILNGQKTGWYFDQRKNRQLISQLSPHKTILDCYCYTGGFGINALNHGAAHVTFIDSSSAAISLLKRNLDLNKLSANNHTIHNADAIEVMKKMLDDGLRYDIVILDPPPLIKNKKDKVSAIKKYSKICSLGLKLVNSGGYLFYSSCSHHMTMNDLKRMIIATAKKDNISIKIVVQTRHDYDHPVHKQLPQSQYLNSILILRD